MWGLAEGPTGKAGPPHSPISALSMERGVRIGEGVSIGLEKWKRQAVLEPSSKTDGMGF